ncbi:hypothetical protein ACIGO6_40530 [Streptomyces sp. NPDC053750]|uniref:hypothetical protein n=1 Tax=Streptomyces sp. NPDC053750 TaxID=3365714 RepID=UPI0037D841FD
MSTHTAGGEARNSILEDAINQETRQGARLDAREGYRARLLYGSQPLDRITVIICVVVGVFVWPVYIYLAYRWVKAADAQIITLSVDSKGELRRIPPENRPSPPPGIASAEKRRRKKIVWLIFLVLLFIVMLATL